MNCPRCAKAMTLSGLKRDVFMVVVSMPTGEEISARVPVSFEHELEAQQPAGVTRASDWARLICYFDENTKMFWLDVGNVNVGDIVTLPSTLPFTFSDV